MCGVGVVGGGAAAVTVLLGSSLSGEFFDLFEFFYELRVKDK